MCKHKQKGIQNWKKRINENKILKIACSKKKLETTWKIIFVLEFLLCQW
jgi:hypothetical protein